MEEITSTAVPITALELRGMNLSNQESSGDFRSNAVHIRNACKSYGFGKNKNLILNNLNMTVPKGSIYGLLGASGCGKTTLLSCIVGRKTLDSGDIWVFSGKPGSKGSGIPGNRLGYMPQDISLYGEFTIKETLLYFGWICGMQTQQIEEKIEFLSKFLMLPPKNSYVKTLSGGQQRRVSLSAALVHDPELLILDEPTVGVDPILRHNIWEHLLNITKDRNTTIILTTHYIDETKQADCVALMRGGYFLAEDSPNNLLQRLNTDNLEEVYLRLSVLQNDSEIQSNQSGVVNNIFVPDDGRANQNLHVVSTSSHDLQQKNKVQNNVNAIDLSDIPPEFRHPMSFWDHLKGVSRIHLGAMFWKNYLWTWRNKEIIIFILFLPIMLIGLFASSIGGDPIGIKLAVKNYELDSINSICTVTVGCNATHLSCRYLKYLEEDKHYIIQYFDTEDEAKNSVKHGKSWAALVFHANYSEALMNRIDLGLYVEDWDIDYSEVDIYQDRSNQEIALLLWRDCYLEFMKYIQEFLKSCHFAPSFVTVPIKFNKPVYGENYPNFTDFAVPGALQTMAFFLAVIVTGGGVILDRKEGCFDRLLTVGISEVEMLLAHLLSDIFVVFLQVILLLVMTFAVCHLTNEGNIFLVFMQVMMTAISGMGFGFFISCVCDNEQTATIIGMGSFMPIILLCGMVWPREGMHYILRGASYVLPLTKSTDSLRSILHRGWGIDNPVVYQGFIYTIIWIIIFLGLSLTAIRFRKY